MSVGAVKAGEAFVEIGGRDKKLGEALARSQKKLKTFGQKVKDLGKTFAKLGAIAVGTIAVISFVKAIKAASEFEETLSKFNAVFKEQAEVTRAWAKAFSMEVGRAEDQVIGFLSTMQDTFVPLGFARDKAAELSKQIVKLAVDLASFNNESEPETIRSLQSALVGNTETVRKYGVIITQVTLGQELLNMGIAGGVQKATEQQKVMARLSIIMKSTTDAQGDAARTSGSFANQMKALNAAFRSLAVTAGQAVLPEMTKIVSAVKEAAAKFGDWLRAGNRLREMFKTLVTAWKISSKVLIFIAGKVAFAFQVIANTVANLVTALTGLQQFAGQDELFFIERRRAANAVRAQEARDKEIEAAKKVGEILQKQKRVLGAIETLRATARKDNEAALATEKQQAQSKIDQEKKVAAQKEKTRKADQKIAGFFIAQDTEKRQKERATLQGAARALLKPGEKEKGKPAGGFGAFASKLLAQRIPRGLQAVGERQLERLKNIAEATAKMKDFLQRLLLIADPQLRGMVAITRSRGEFALRERRGQQEIGLERIIKAFEGDPEGLKKAIDVWTAVGKEQLAELRRSNQIAQEELVFGLSG